MPKIEENEKKTVNEINNDDNIILNVKGYKSLKGIRNIGNTCYMNTALQCMSNCVELRNYFLFGNHFYQDLYY